MYRTLDDILLELNVQISNLETYAAISGNMREEILDLLREIRDKLLNTKCVLVEGISCQYDAT